MSATSRFDLDNYLLWTALITTFTNEGEVDYEDLSVLLDQQQRANNGILILGSTGEALNLDIETRKQLVTFCCDQQLSVPLMVGVGGSLLKETLDWVEWLNQQSIDSQLMVTPLYSKPGHHGQTAWFNALLDAASMPCVI